MGQSTLPGVVGALANRVRSYATINHGTLITCRIQAVSTTIRLAEGGSASAHCATPLTTSVATDSASCTRIVGDGVRQTAGLRAKRRTFEGAS